MSTLHPSPCSGDNVLHKLVSYQFDSDQTLRSTLQRKPHLVNSPNEDGETPLFYAVRCAYFQGIRYLLSGGANVVAVDRYNRTPLHYAALLPEYSGDIIQLLCRDGDTTADVPMDLEGRVPLHLATIVGNAGGVQELLSWGAFVDTVAGDTGETALHMAAAEGHMDCAKMLLMAGALRGAVGYKGLTPYAIARRAGWRALADLLEPPLNAPSSRGEGGGGGSSGGGSRMPATYASPSPTGLRREHSSGSSSSSNRSNPVLNSSIGSGLAPIIPPPNLPPPPPLSFQPSSSSGRGTPPGYRSGGGGGGYRSPTSPLLRNSPSPSPDTPPPSYHPLPPPPPYHSITSAASRLSGGGPSSSSSSSSYSSAFPRPPRTPPPTHHSGGGGGASWKTDTEGETDGGYATPKSTGAASHHSFVSALGDTTEDDRDGGGGGGMSRRRASSTVSGNGNGGLAVGALQRDLSEARSRVLFLEGQVRELERKLADPVALREALKRVEDRERGGKVTLATGIATMPSNSNADSTSGGSSSGSSGGGGVESSSNTTSSTTSSTTTTPSSSARRRGGSVEGGGRGVGGGSHSPSNLSSEYTSTTLLSTPTSAAAAGTGAGAGVGAGAGAAPHSPTAFTPPTPTSAASMAPPVSVLRVTFEDKVMKGGIGEEEGEEEEVEEEVEEGVGDSDGDGSGEGSTMEGGVEGEASILRKQHTSTAKKMSVWTAFFENAAKAKFGGGGGDEGSGEGEGGEEGLRSSALGGISPGNLALLQAVSAGDLPAVENILLLGGASCTTLVKCPTHWIPYPRLSLEAEGGGEEGGKNLSLAIKLDTMEGFSLSALHVAAALGHVGILEVLGDSALMEREGGEEGGGSGSGSGKAQGSSLDGGGEGMAVGGRGGPPSNSEEGEGGAAWPTTPSSTGGGGLGVFGRGGGGLGGVGGGGAAGAASTASGGGSGGGLDVRDGQGATPLLLASSLALHHWMRGEQGMAEAFSRCATHLLGCAADASTSSFTLTGVGLGHVIKGLEVLGVGGSGGSGSSGGAGIPGAAELASMLTEYSELVWRGSEEA